MLLGRGERGKRGDQGSFGHTGKQGETGRQGVAGLDAPIHPWRWRFLFVWILVFSTIVFYSISSVRDTSASLHDLQKTNCGLKTFLIKSTNVRQLNANTSTGKARTENDAAAKGYKELAKTISGIGRCKLPHYVEPTYKPL